ncbi:GtrA family protein [candidate division WWE3 bacterium]|uniref:GtrA family protein n=1 Tax=candidate division WWE3 bacterium TaxID=2053526 RepID=A0A955LIQ3_UNCKA|nr:GtrA family protein [candidate division WWE3 bacterium]
MIDKIRAISPQFLQPFITPQFVRYLVIGLGTLFIEVGLYWVLVNIFDIVYIWASILEFPILFTFNFFGHKFFTFNNKHEPTSQLVRYILLVIVNGIASNALLYLFVDILNINYLIAKFLTIGCIISWNFLALGKFVYRENPSQKAR